MKGLNDCIDTCCNKHANDKYILTEWKYKQDRCKNKNTFASAKGTITFLEKYPKWVTPLDKVNGFIISYICLLTIYFLALIKELDLDNDATQIYKICIQVNKLKIKLFLIT